MTRGSLVISLLPPADTAGRAVGPLVGFAVSRAVGNAVVRHRTARRLRHLMRDRLDRLPLGSRVVVRALPMAATRSASALAGDLDAGLDRLLGWCG